MGKTRAQLVADYRVAFLHDVHNFGQDEEEWAKKFDDTVLPQPGWHDVASVLFRQMMKKAGV